MKEHEKLQAWLTRMKLDHTELGRQIGYSREAVYWFCRGETPPRRYRNSNHVNREIDPAVWQRFKLACAGFAAQRRTGKQFNW